MQHVLKSDPALRDLEQVQVDGPGFAYLFFYDRHGHRSLSKEAALAMRSHLADTFAEWIGGLLILMWFLSCLKKDASTHPLPREA